MKSLLIDGCSILDENSDYGLRENVSILIEGSRIVDVSSPPPANRGVDRTISGSGLLAVPGLISAHTHSPENFLKGVTEKVPLEYSLVRAH